MIEQLYDLSLNIFFFPQLLYFIKHPSLFYQHLFHYINIYINIANFKYK